MAGGCLTRHRDACVCALLFHSGQQNIQGGGGGAGVGGTGGDAVSQGGTGNKVTAGSGGAGVGGAGGGAQGRR